MMKISLSRQPYLVKTYLADVSDFRFALRRTRASSRNVGKISSYQVRLSRKRNFHCFNSATCLQCGIYSMCIYTEGDLACAYEINLRCGRDDHVYCMRCKIGHSYLSSIHITI